MTQSSPISTEASDKSDVSHSKEAIARFLTIGKGYWTGEKRMEAWRLTAAVFVLVLLTLAVQIGVNRWNRFFFDALDHRNGAALGVGAMTIAGLAFAAALAAVLLVRCRMSLQLRWRKWLTSELVRRWLTDRRFYQLTIAGADDLNPEYRIADDSLQSDGAFRRFRHRLVKRPPFGGRLPRYIVDGGRRG